MRILAKRKGLFFVIFSLSLTSLFFAYLNLSLSNSIRWRRLLQTSSDASTIWPGSKLILLWTGLYLKPASLSSWGVNSLSVQKCPFNCSYSVDKSLHPDADAIIFHASEALSRHGKPQWRSPEQIYIMLWHESPANTFLNLGKYPDFFNWTATYRIDGDILFAYGSFIHGESNVPPIEDIIKRKRKLVAWVASNCVTPSDRESLVKELSQHVQVDIFGDCGHHEDKINGPKCPDWGKDCYAQLGVDYKFYLALENSICKDYVTEKFFKALTFGMVPLVFSTPKVDNYRSYPGGSYIDLSKFPSMTAAADYLKFLDKNQSEYAKYFDWRKEYSVDSSRSQSIGGFLCKVCTDIHLGVRRGQGYPDIKEWWHGSKEEPSCDNKKSVGLSWNSIKKMWYSI